MRTLEHAWRTHTSLSPGFAVSLLVLMDGNSWCFRRAHACTAGSWTTTADSSQPRSFPITTGFLLRRGNRIVFLAGWLSIIAASLLFGFTAVGVFLLITIAVLLVVARVLSTHRRWDDRRITKARETLRVWCAPNARLPQVGRRRIIRLYRLASFRHAFSPDRRCLAAGLDEQVHLWDLDECWFICRLDVQEQVLCIEFSPNGSYVAVGTTDRI